MNTHNGEFDVFGIRIENVDPQHLVNQLRRLSPPVRTFVVDAVAVDALVVDEDNPGPRWVEPLQGRCGASGNPRRLHHSMSMTAAFKPEPMPMQATLSPDTRCSEFVANVKGTDAGPMLPARREGLRHTFGIDVQRHERSLRCGSSTPDGSHTS